MQGISDGCLDLTAFGRVYILYGRGLGERVLLGYGGLCSVKQATGFYCCELGVVAF